LIEPNIVYKDTTGMTNHMISTDVCEQVFASTFQAHSHLRYGERKYGEIFCFLTYEHQYVVKEPLPSFQTNVQLISVGHDITKVPRATCHKAVVWAVACHIRVPENSHSKWQNQLRSYSFMTRLRTQNSTNSKGQKEKYVR